MLNGRHRATWAGDLRHWGEQSHVVEEAGGGAATRHVLIVRHVGSSAVFRPTAALMGQYPVATVPSRPPARASKAPFDRFDRMRYAPTAAAIAMAMRGMRSSEPIFGSISSSRSWNATEGPSQAGAIFGELTLVISGLTLPPVDAIALI